METLLPVIRTQPTPVVMDTSDDIPTPVVMAIPEGTIIPVVMVMPVGIPVAIATGWVVDKVGVVSEEKRVAGV